MKKLISLFLVVTMLYCICPYVFAVNIYDQDDNEAINVPVSYTSAGTEAYTITVPTHLTPGESGVVVVEGKWASNRQLVITADANVILTNSINSADKKLLNIVFAGISKVGNNTTAISVSENISIADISDAFFGTWFGTFYYNVEIKDVS